jgi:hypothetical protein
MQKRISLEIDLIENAKKYQRFTSTQFSRRENLRKPKTDIPLISSSEDFCCKNKNEKVIHIAVSLSM